MAKRLEIPLDLNTSRAQRASKALTTDIASAGTAAEQTGASGTIAFGAIAAGAVAAAAAITIAISEVERLDAAHAEASRRQADRIQTGSTALTRDLINQVFALTRQDPQEIQRIANEAAQRLPGVSEDDFLLSQIQQLSLIPGAQQADVQSEVETLRLSRAVPIDVGTQLEATLIKLFGLGDVGQRQQQIAEIAAVAEESGFTPGQFATIITKAGPELSAGGLSLSQQVAYINAISGFFVGQPELATTALKRISRLSLLGESKLMEQILTAANFDPKSRNLDEIRIAVVKFIREGGDTAALGTALGNKEIVGELVKLAKPAFDIGLEEAKTNAAGASFANEIAAADQFLSFESSQAESATAAGRAADFEFGKPGSTLEAATIVEQALLRVSNVPGFQQGLLDFERAQNRIGRATSADEAEELFRLEALYPAIRDGLERVEFGDRANVSPGRGIASRAVTLQVQLKNARARALGGGAFTVLGRNRANAISAYRGKMEQAVEFLRDVQIGGVVDLPLARDVAPTAEESREAGEVLEGFGRLNTPDSGTDSGIGDQSSAGGVNIGVFYGNSPRQLAGNNITRTGVAV